MHTFFDGVHSCAASESLHLAAAMLLASVLWMCLLHVQPDSSNQRCCRRLPSYVFAATKETLAASGRHDRVPH